jgi:phosphatidylinositol-3-phosphatase
MHSGLSTPFVYNGVTYTGDLGNIAQGDNFLSIIIPKIMASKAYKRNGVIVIWNDETEGTNQNDFSHTMTEIVISPLAKGNAYASSKDYTHSSDLNTLQKVFQVTATTPTGFLNDAANPSPAAPLI